MMDFIESCFIGPNFPASVMMVLILIYGLMVAIGGLDIDLFDVDLDVDVDMDGAVTSVGFIALKFLNIGNVPIMIWASAFGLSWWTASMLLWEFFDQARYHEDFWHTAMLIGRNVVVGIAAAKFATQPMVKFFDHTDNYKPEDLIGQECEVTTYEVTADAGQAKFATDAAPLLIDVRSEDAPLAKGDRARIVEFDPDEQLYFITKSDTEVST
jgi:hypothetical protein